MWHPNSSNTSGYSYPAYYPSPSVASGYSFQGPPQSGYSGATQSIPSGTSQHDGAGSYVYLHPLLRTEGPLIWDLRTEPTRSARKRTHASHQRLKSDELNQTATNPPFRQMTITIPELNRSETISAAPDKPGVTVKEILLRIYHACSTELSIDQLGPGHADFGDHLPYVYAANESRRHFTGNVILPGGEPVKHSDWLVDYHMFSGIVWVGRPGEYSVVVKRPDPFFRY